jgi:hypothetical protein
MVPAEGGCGVSSGGGSDVWSAIPGAGVRIPGAGKSVPGAEGRGPEAGAETVLLGSEYRHLAREVIDLLRKCGVVGGGGGPTLASAGWVATSEMRSAQRAAASKLRSCWPARMFCMFWGSRLDQMVYRNSSVMSGARPLRCLRNWDGLRSPISSSVSTWRMRCSLEGDSRRTSSILSVVYGSRSGGEVMMSSTSAAYRWSSCEITWKNLVLSLLTPAKKNCSSAWANHTAGRSAQNGGSRTATFDTSAGGELSAASMLRRGHQCGMSVFTATTKYNFVTGRRKLFQAGCACWIPGGAFCVAVSWLAGGENCGLVEGRLVSSFRWKLWLREGPFCFLFLSAEQRAGDADDLWRIRLRCD